MADIIIVKESEGTSSKKAYRISNLDNFRWDVRTPVSPMPLPEENHEENVLVKMEGNSAVMDCSWRIMDGYQGFGTWAFDSVTKGMKFTADTTSDTDVKDTATDQIQEWRDNFIPVSVKDRFSVVVQEGTGDDSIKMEDIGTIGGINFNISGDSPVVWSATLQFFVGTVYTIFEADVPERPSKVTLSTPSANTIKVEWEESTSYASSSDKPVTTGASIKIKKDGGIWREANAQDSAEYALGNGGEDGAPASSTTKTFTITASTENEAGCSDCYMESGSKYRVKVAVLSVDSHEAFIKHFRNGKTSGGSSFITTT